MHAYQAMEQGRRVAWASRAPSLFRGVAGFWYVQVLDAIPDILIAPHFLYPRDATAWNSLGTFSNLITVEPQY